MRESDPTVREFYRKKLAWAMTFTFDGLVYALLTAGAFGWLWPA